MTHGDTPSSWDLSGLEHGIYIGKVFPKGGTQVNSMREELEIALCMHVHGKSPKRTIYILAGEVGTK